MTRIRPIVLLRQSTGASLDRCDRARLSGVKELFAAVILQHGEAPEDFLLAHEFRVVATVKGKNDLESGSLAAAAEDRFLMNIDQPQRSGRSSDRKVQSRFACTRSGTA